MEKFLIYTFNKNNRPKVFLKSKKLIGKAYEEFYHKNNILFDLENTFFDKIEEKLNNDSSKEVEVDSFAYNILGEILFICPVFTEYSTPLFPFMFEDNYNLILKPYLEINKN
jgi:hypothetical protein